MALPPDPIEEVIPLAAAGIIGRVTAVISEDPQKPFPKVPKGTTSAPGEVAKQLVELTVDESLFGKLAAGAKVKAVKPAGEYKLTVGNGGPFLLQLAAGKDAIILGRYGPDSYGKKAILEAAQRAKK